MTFRQIEFNVRTWSLTPSARTKGFAICSPIMTNVEDHLVTKWSLLVILERQIGSKLHQCNNSTMTSHENVTSTMELMSS